MKVTALQIYGRPAEHPILQVPQHVIIRAVKALGWVEALALIRGAYMQDDGTYASLEDARAIYDSIIRRSQ